MDPIRDNTTLPSIVGAPQDVSDPLYDPLALPREPLASTASFEPLQPPVPLVPAPVPAPWPAVALPTPPADPGIPQPTVPVVPLMTPAAIAMRAAAADVDLNEPRVRNDSTGYSFEADQPVAERARVGDLTVGDPTDEDRVRAREDADAARDARADAIEDAAVDAEHRTTRLSTDRRGALDSVTGYRGADPDDLRRP